MKPICVLFLVISFALPASSQVLKLASALNKFAKNYLPERVYIQYDRAAYLPGDTIWFKVYLTSDVLPSTDSKTFYMDWADDSGRTIAHNSYPIAFGSTHGQFVIPEGYSGRQVHVQAYTKWMLNFDPAFLYRKAITIEVGGGDVAGRNPSIKDTLYFFPEGGKIIAGINNRIAFKAINNYGIPFPVTGVIKDSSGYVIDSFQSRHDGMGYFYLLPVSGKDYTAGWKDEAGIWHKAHIPAIMPSGVNMQIELDGDKRKFIVRRTNQVEDELRKLHIVATQQQQLVFEADIDLDNRSKVEASFSVSGLPSGILRFTLFNKDWLPVAERISFINNGEYRFSPTIHADTISLEKKGLNILHIDVPDSLIANLSIAITDADIAATDSRDNIISSLLLTSELKGKVYNPAYYFKDRSLQTQQYLDLVMLTNGWRKYDWQKVIKGTLPVLKYAKDSAYLHFSGKIEDIPSAAKRILADNTTKHWIMFSLRPLHDTLSHFLTVPVSSDGHFSKPALLVFDSLVVGYQFSDKKINSRSPKIVFMPDKLNVSIPDTLFENYMENKSVYVSNALPGTYYPDSTLVKSRLFFRKRGILLKTVTISGKAKTKEEKMEEEYTSPSMFRGSFGYSRDVMDDKDAARNWNIFIYLQHNSKGGLQITIGPQGFPSLKWSGGRGEPGVYYNESRVSVEFMLNIPMSEIAYVKTIPPPSFGSDSTVGAVAVYTKKGEDYYKSLPTKMNIRTITGYTIIKEFYSPEYDVSKDSPGPDLRTTLYWNPMIIAQRGSTPVKIRFYNNDDGKSYRVILEGMTKDGKLAREEKLIR